MRYFKSDIVIGGVYIGCPCKGCENRCQGCHGSCDSYKAFKEKRNKAKLIRHIDTITRSSRREKIERAVNLRHRRNIK